MTTTTTTTTTTMIASCRCVFFSSCAMTIDASPNSLFHFQFSSLPLYSHLLPSHPLAAVAPRGNAARSGLVKKGDIVVMTSATFGNQLWSCKGSGLQRVLKAIKVRAGNTVTLVLESETEVRPAAVARACLSFLFASQATATNTALM